MNFLIGKISTIVFNYPQNRTLFDTNFFYRKLKLRNVTFFFLISINKTYSVEFIYANYKTFLS